MKFYSLTLGILLSTVASAAMAKAPIIQCLIAKNQTIVDRVFLSNQLSIGSRVSPTNSPVGSTDYVIQLSRDSQNERKLSVELSAMRKTQECSNDQTPCYELIAGKNSSKTWSLGTEDKVVVINLDNIDVVCQNLTR